MRTRHTLAGVEHDELSPATRVVALGRVPREPGAHVGAPLTLTSTYHADGPVNYARAGNPTWTAFEDALGSLEGGDALVFASGMAAVAAALSLIPHGGRVVVPTAAYNGTLVTLADRAEAGEVDVTHVDVTDTESVVAALDGAAMLWIESPTNPLLDVAEVDKLARAANDRNVIVVVDNTFATPLLQQPLTLGADIVVHSATKYLSGHSDLLLGAAVTGQDEAGKALHERLRRHRQLHGAIAGPMETWLALRGLRTLSVRFDRACANAAELASRLGGHAGVERVRYPGVGAMISIDVASDAAGAERVAAAVRLWVHSTSLGGVESQIERRRRQPGEPEAVPENLLRLSVGIEDVEDLWRDLDAALGAI